MINKYVTLIDNELTINTANDTSISYISNNILIPDPENKNTENTSNTKNVPILDLNDILSIKEYIDTIKNGSLPPMSLDQHLLIKVLQEKFNNFIYN